MTTRIESDYVEQNSSRWQKVRAWLTAIDEAIAYDPQVEADATIRQLRESVSQLETKVADLGRRDRHSQQE